MGIAYGIFLLKVVIITTFNEHFRIIIVTILKVIVNYS